MNFIFVGLGGAVGAMLRYALSMLPNKTEFPIWTLVTNLIGAVAIGFIAQTAIRKGLSNNAVLFLKTGLCGGFTTFSTFSLEAYTLFHKGAAGLGSLYAAASVVLCIGGIVLGTWLANMVVSGAGTD